MRGEAPDTKMQATVMAGIVGVLIDEGMTCEQIVLMWAPEKIRQAFMIVSAHDAERERLKQPIGTPPGARA